jgi:hypothetical protein
MKDINTLPEYDIVMHFALCTTNVPLACPDYFASGDAQASRGLCGQVALEEHCKNEGSEWCAGC